MVVASGIQKISPSEYKEIISKRGRKDRRKNGFWV